MKEQEPGDCALGRHLKSGASVSRSKLITDYISLQRKRCWMRVLIRLWVPDVSKQTENVMSRAIAELMKSTLIERVLFKV